jgi:hypothetical protein
MAVRKITTPAGSIRWQGRTRTPDGRQVAHNFDTQRAAKAWVTEQESQKARGTYVDPKQRKQTLGSYGDAWLADQVTRPRTQALYDTVWRTHIRPALGDRPLGSLRQVDIRTFVAQLVASGLAATTIKTHLTILKAILNAAVRDRVIHRTRHSAWRCRAPTSRRSFRSRQRRSDRSLTRSSRASGLW